MLAAGFTSNIRLIPRLPLAASGTGLPIPSPQYGTEGNERHDEESKATACLSVPMSNIEAVARVTFLQETHGYTGQHSSMIAATKGPMHEAPLLSVFKVVSISFPLFFGRRRILPLAFCAFEDVGLAWSFAFAEGP